MNATHITRTFALATALCMGVAGAAHAAQLARYDFETFSAASLDTDANSLASDVTFGAGLSSAGSIVSLNGNEYIQMPANVTPGTVGDAVSGNTYVSFTITPTLAEHGLDLTSLTFNGSTSWGGSTPASWGMVLRSSVDNYASDILSHSQGTGMSGNAWLLLTADLTGPSFQKLEGTVEFRIYVWDSAGSADSNLRIDDITLSGEVTPVPEPAFIGGLLCCAGLLVRRVRA